MLMLMLMMMMMMMMMVLRSVMRYMVFMDQPYVKSSR
jgi:hypothetical protein